MRCAAHTLQLAVEDLLKKDKSIASLIVEVRKLVAKLRTPTITYILKSKNLKRPSIDCTTRWGSTFDMLRSLLPLQDFCKEISTTSLKKLKNFSQWTAIQKLCATLTPVKKCTKKLQYEQLTLSDFYGYWLECIIEIEKMNTSFSKLLLKFMRQRQSVLLNNDILLAAVFLDPRYKILLDENKIERAKDHLKKVWIRQLKIKMMNEEPENEVDRERDTDTDSSGHHSVSDDFDNYLKLKEKEINVSKRLFGTKKKQQNSLLSSSRYNIDTLLNNYETTQGRINRKENVLMFWEENKNNFPELYKLSLIVMAVPSTQVSVERLFSGLKFVLSPQRSNIKEKHLEEQLLVRTNRIFDSDKSNCKKRKFS